MSSEGQEAAPVIGVQTSLESSDAVLCPLFVGLGHLLDSPTDWVVSRKTQNGVVISELAL